MRPACSPLCLRRQQLLPVLAEAAGADAQGNKRDAARYVTTVGTHPQKSVSALLS